MADELGAVRRTARPAGDRQTPETAPQESAGTTNTASPVSGDQPAVSSRVSSQDPAGLAELRAKLAQEPGPGAFCVDGCPCGQTGSAAAACALDTATDVEAYAALPECLACEGTGKDDHATVFEAPLAVHFAGPPVEIVGRRRQLCMWCGHVLADSPRVGAGALPPWPVGTLVRVEDGVGTVEPHEPGDELPPGCCALPDDEPDPDPDADGRAEQQLTEDDHVDLDDEPWPSEEDQ